MRPADDPVERAAAVLGERARRQVPIGPLTSYRVGGPAALFVEVADEADLELAGRAVRASGVPVLVVGRGSNLLVADRGFPGLALVLGAGFTDIAFEGTDVVAGAAVSLPVLARRTAVAGLTGMEWSVGVPGSVGGAVRMNAGGHGSDMSQSLVSVRVYDLDAGETTGGSGLHGSVAAARLDRRGSAFVSPKHANFVQVDDGGSADDVAGLVGEVARLVAARTGVRLRVENHLIGFPEQAR